MYTDVLLQTKLLIIQLLEHDNKLFKPELSLLKLISLYVCVCVRGQVWLSVFITLKQGKIIGAPFRKITTK